MKGNDMAVPVSDVQRLESERLRTVPHDRADPLSESFRELLGLIAAECARAGMLPPGWAAPHEPPRHTGPLTGAQKP